MTNQQHDLKAIVEEYVDLKSLNPKPLFETLEYLFNICGEKPVSEYTRDDARQFVKVYGAKVKTTSVRRRLNSLNAVFNYAIYELDLPHRNPFSRIIIKDEGKDATPREPFSVDELEKLYSASLAFGKLRLILPILGETGCRLSEVLGMLKDDVTEEDGLYVIHIRENDVRGLKTESSKRSLPIVSGYAREALERLLESSKGNPRLFPRYAAKDYFNPTTASATLCKHLKAVYGGVRYQMKWSD